MTRRELLLLPSAAYAMLGQADSTSGPQNLSFPLQNIEGSVTPPDLFFVRDHFSEPEVYLRTWRLRIEGRVTMPLELTLADILESPTNKLEAVLECAGNGAGASAASNAVWEGVPLGYLLSKARFAHDAVAVLLEGADTGRLMQGSPSLPYCRSVPIAKCLRPESLVAFKMNDRFLPRRNGFPARALFPGWYGMDSVKWLQRIVVLASSDQSSNYQLSGMNQLYNRIAENTAGKLTITPLTEIQVKSVIAWPVDNANLPVGRHVIRGFAWTGAGLVRSVTVSDNGGHAWVPARLGPRPRPFSWVRWEYAWSAPPGDHVLVSRASDDSGREQPLQRDLARKDGYELNFCAPVRCFVR